MNDMLSKCEKWSFRFLEKNLNLFDFLSMDLNTILCILTKCVKIKSLFESINEAIAVDDDIVKNKCLNDIGLHHFIAYISHFLILSIDFCLSKVKTKPAECASSISFGLQSQKRLNEKPHLSFKSI